MYIILKQNHGGSKSVLLISSERLPGKKNPCSRVVKNFGSAKTEEELQHLELTAENYLNLLNITKAPEAP